MEHKQFINSTDFFLYAVCMLIPCSILQPRIQHLCCNKALKNLYASDDNTKATEKSDTL